VGLFGIFVVLDGSLLRWLAIVPSSVDDQIPGCAQAHLLDVAPKYPSNP
jgi:hypothetical protein